MFLFLPFFFFFFLIKSFHMVFISILGLLRMLLEPSIFQNSIILIHSRGVCDCTFSPYIINYTWFHHPSWIITALLWGTDYHTFCMQCHICMKLNICNSWLCFLREAWFERDVSEKWNCLNFVWTIDFLNLLISAQESWYYACRLILIVYCAYIQRQQEFIETSFIKINWPRKFPFFSHVVH